MAKTETDLLLPSDTFVGSQEQGSLSSMVGREGTQGGLNSLCIIEVVETSPER